MNKTDNGGQIKVSIIVATYNSDLERLKITLFSILQQREISFEIIIADDGSVNNLKSEITNYFAEKDFSEYKLSLLEQNMGTVKNLLNAEKHCSGIYIKVLSPGDYLYDPYVLRDWVAFMSDNDCEFSFGRYACYSANENSVDRVLSSIRRGFRPFDLSAYYPVNKEKIIKYRYLLLDDYPVGAAIMHKKSFMNEYMELLDGVSKYTEDACFRIAVADGIYPRFFDRYTIWYSYGDGISTNKNYKWWKIVYDDIYRAGLIIKARIKKNDWFNTRLKVFLILSKYVATKVISKYILFPSLLFLRLQKDKCENEVIFDVENLRKLLLREDG